MNEDEMVAALAEPARELFDDPCVEVTRDRWVNREDDASVVAWALVHGLIDPSEVRR